MIIIHMYTYIHICLKQGEYETLYNTLRNKVLDYRIWKLEQR